MSFYNFMQSFVGDDTPLGDLACWISQDANFPREVVEPGEILAYFIYSSLGDTKMLPNVKRAIDIYSRQ